MFRTHTNGFAGNTVHNNNGTNHLINGEIKMAEKTKQKPAAAKAPKPAITHTWESKELVQRVQDGLKARLINELDRFIPEAYPEEARFLVEVLNERDASGGHNKTHDTYTVPLFSAMETVISGYSRRVIMLRDEHMVPAVEEFIRSLETQVESNPDALKRPQRTPTEIRARRERDLKSFAERFAKHATTDDLFFLESVLERWEVYQDYVESDRPLSPITAAFQYEVDERWLIPVDYDHRERVCAFVRIVGQENWLSDLLKWIADEGSENLSPCLIASKAAGMQEAWDTARDAAA
jgi:hypothetical protein